MKWKLLCLILVAQVLFLAFRPIQEQPKITVYGSNSCHHCTDLKKALDTEERLYQFFDIDVDKVKEAEMVSKLRQYEVTGNITIPVVELNDKQPLMYYSLKSRLYKVLPPIRIPVVSEMTSYFLNSNNKESKKVITQMMLDTDFRFMNWCIFQIAKVDLKPEYLETYINLNGDNDRLVKAWIGHSGLIVSGGSHFMAYDRAEEIASKIRSMLNP